MGLRIVGPGWPPGVSALGPQPPANRLHPLRGAQTGLNRFRNRSKSIPVEEAEIRLRLVRAGSIETRSFPVRGEDYWPIFASLLFAISDEIIATVESDRNAF